MNCWSVFALAPDKDDRRRRCRTCDRWYHLDHEDIIELHCGMHPWPIAHHHVPRGFALHA